MSLIGCYASVITYLYQASAKDHKNEIAYLVSQTKEERKICEQEKGIWKQSAYEWQKKYSELYDKIYNDRIKISFEGERVLIQSTVKSEK